MFFPGPRPGGSGLAFSPYAISALLVKPRTGKFRCRFGAARRNEALLRDLTQLVIPAEQSVSQFVIPAKSRFAERGPESRNV
jgi:hypothetical protein